MTEIVVNAELAAQIRAAGPEVVLLAEDGTEIGRLRIEPSKNDGLWYTPEERAKRMSGTGRSLKAVLDDLRTKYGD